MLGKTGSMGSQSLQYCWAADSPSFDGKLCVLFSCLFLVLFSSVVILEFQSKLICFPESFPQISLLQQPAALGAKSILSCHQLQRVDVGWLARITFSRAGAAPCPVPAVPWYQRGSSSPVEQSVHLAAVMDWLGSNALYL